MNNSEEQIQSILGNKKDSRKPIELPCNNRLVSEFAQELGKLIAGQDIFVRDEIVCVPNEAGDGLKLMTGETLRTWIEKYVLPYQKRSQTGSSTLLEIRNTMRLDDARAVLCAPQFISQLRRIERINPVQMPGLDESGNLRLLPDGYDSLTRTFTAKKSLAIFTLAKLEEARRILDDLLCEFCFADPGRSKAVAVSAMVTVFARLILPRNALCPCFLYLANAPGAGKTLLVKTAVGPVLGILPTGSKPKDDDEMRKLLDSTVIEAKPVLFLDNLKEKLSSPALESFLTAQTHSGRVLGHSKTFTAQNNVTVFITGNHCTLSADMTRRSLIVELLMQEERAEDRTFKRNLETELLNDRDEILSALYALVRNWYEAGKPGPSRKNSNFPEWSEIIGGIVQAAGYECPLQPAEVEVDLELADMRRLVEVALQDCIERQLKFPEIVEYAQEHGLFVGIVPESGDLENANRNRLAKLLLSYDKRNFTKGRFTVEGKGRKRAFRFTSNSNEP